MEFSQAKNETWMYCNFPEQISNDVVDQYLLNTIRTQGTCELFYSYGSAPLDRNDVFYITAWATNTSGKSAYLQIKHCCDFSTNHDYNVYELWRDYVKNPKDVPVFISDGDKETDQFIKDVTVSPGDTKKFYSRRVNGHLFFSDVLNFYTDAEVRIRLFAYRKDTFTDYSKLVKKVTEAPYSGVLIDDPTKEVVHGQKSKSYSKLSEEVYSGKGKAFNIYTTIQLSVSELMSEKNIFFETGNPYPTQNLNTDEFISINFPTNDGNGTRFTAAEIPGGGYGNLGNWGVHYNMNMSIVNDTDKTQTVYGSLISPMQSNIVLLDNNKSEANPICYPIATGDNADNGTEAFYGGEENFLKKTYPEKSNLVNKITRGEKKNDVCAVQAKDNLKSTKFIEIEIKAKQTVKFKYIFILATENKGYMMHRWNLK